MEIVIKCEKKDDNSWNDVFGVIPERYDELLLKAARIRNKYGSGTERIPIKIKEIAAICDNIQEFSLIIGRIMLPPMQCDSKETFQRQEETVNKFLSQEYYDRIK